MEKLVLEITNLRKTYSKKRIALDNLNLSLKEGSILGLVGPNGAGKTTTFSIICGYTNPDYGTIDILGAGSFDPFYHKGKISTFPQDSTLGRETTLYEQMMFFAELQGLDKISAKQQIDELLILVDLESRSKDKIKNLSHGMLKRLGIAQSFLGKPEIILLDEPTNGLDPRQGLVMRDYIKSFRGKASIIISSHNLHEIEQICDHVALMDKGNAIFYGKTQELTGKQISFRIVFINELMNLKQLEESFPFCNFTINKSEESTTLLVEIKPQTNIDTNSIGDISHQRAIDINTLTTDVISALIEQKVKIREVLQGNTLEQVYLKSS